jgi:hypothetical protein
MISSQRLFSIEPTSSKYSWVLELILVEQWYDSQQLPRKFGQNISLNSYVCIQHFFTRINRSESEPTDAAQMAKVLGLQEIHAMIDAAQGARRTSFALPSCIIA